MRRLYPIYEFRTVFLIESITPQQFNKYSKYRETHVYEYLASNKNPQFLSIEEFADTIVDTEKYPKRTFYDYGFPKELSTILY